MINFYISLKTAKQLKEWGCELDFIHYYNENNLIFPKYHILEDICVKYATDFFGENNDGYINQYGFYVGDKVYDIILLLQENKKQEAEQYILDNTIFNPKNK